MNGSLTESSTSFKHYGVKQFNLTLNGSSCDGFPLNTFDGAPSVVYQKFLKDTNRMDINICSRMINMLEFKHNWIYSHQFKAEKTNQGWVGINLTLDEAWTTNHSMGMSYHFFTFINNLI